LLLNVPVSIGCDMSPEMIPVADVSGLSSAVLAFFTAARGSYDFLLASKAAFFGSTFFAFDKILLFCSTG